MRHAEERGVNLEPFRLKTVFRKGHILRAVLADSTLYISDRHAKIEKILHYRSLGLTKHAYKPS